MDRRTDWNEPAHLRDATGFSPPIVRHTPVPALAEVIRWFWMPAWDLPEGQVSEQRSLQYPVCLIVVGNEYARLIGPTTGLAVKRLEGRGWACGVTLTVGAGALILGGSVSQLTDGHVDLADLETFDGASLTARIHRALGADPTDPENQTRAVEAVEEALAPFAPLDDEGRLVNEIVDCTETDPTVLRVRHLTERFGLGDRQLQRLCARRVGLSPKWLIQRRRLQEVAETLRSPDPPSLAELAARLGYADQAHLTRDFRTVTGVTPARFAEEPAPHADPTR